MNGEFLFLGTGASSGIPKIGCHCAVCKSDDPHNKRFRPSALVSFDGKKYLIDTGPDLRMQALKHEMEHLDGVLLTHSHYDHIAGIDELRAYYLLNHRVLPVLTSKTTFEELKVRYYYLFGKKRAGDSFAAQLDFQVLPDERGKVEFIGLPIQYVTYVQGGMKVMGFRFGNLAYLTDIREFPETIYEDMEGVHTLIVGALKEEPSPLHFSISEAVAFAEKIKAKKAYFTHVGHDLDYKTTNAKLPRHISLAYDGLKVGFSYDG